MFRKRSWSSLDGHDDDARSSNKRQKLAATTTVANTETGGAATGRPGATQQQDDELDLEGETEDALLTPEQQRAIDLVLKDRKCIFITSRDAGSGKSFLLRALKRASRRANVSYADTASTGIAAANISAPDTFHSWMGLKLEVGRVPTAELVSDVLRDKTLRERWRQTDVLAIEEVSMTDWVLLDEFDKIARAVRGQPKVPFGGICVVLVGDFGQLMPVKPLERGRQHEFLFETELWKSVFANNIVYLTQPFRQTDPEFIALLRRVRFGETTESDFVKLENKVRESGQNKDSTATGDGDKPGPSPASSSTKHEKEEEDKAKNWTVLATRLFPTNREVDECNDRAMRQLQPDVKKWIRYASTERVVGDRIGQYKARFDAFLERMRRECPARPEVALCRGAQVMLVANLDKQRKLINGSRGVVIGFAPGEQPQQQGVTPHADQTTGQLHSFFVPAQPTKAKQLYPVVRFENDQILVVGPHSWKEEVKRGQTFAAYSQVPLRLCWALTIHKAQGQSLKRAAMRLSFPYKADPGQVYVALSRLETWDGLILLAFSRAAVVAHPKVRAFYKRLEERHLASRSSSNKQTVV